MKHKEGFEKKRGREFCELADDRGHWKRHTARVLEISALFAPGRTFWCASWDPSILLGCVWYQGEDLRDFL